MTKTKINEWVLVITTASLVTFYISFVLVAINAGIKENFLFIWMRSWLCAFLLAVPSLRYVGPSVRVFFNRKFNTP